MKLDCKFFNFLISLFFSVFTLLGQGFEVKPQTFETEGNIEFLLSPKENPNYLPDYLKKDFFKNTPDPNNKNEYFDRPKIEMGEQETFIDPGEFYLNKLRSPEKEKNPNDFKVDQYLGDFKSNAPYVQVIFRDHEAADGDRVKILFNDRVVEANVLLQERFKRLKVDLISGFNKIDFVALNQGESGPNTAEIRVYDNKGMLLMANQWNLATGTKATLIVAKE
tara:strand:+ start:1333 stop:1998 length:666 start_codon:yes stop_codon:yes gene_type:complete